MRRTLSAFFIAGCGRPAKDVQLRAREGLSSPQLDEYQSVCLCAAFTLCYSLSMIIDKNRVRGRNVQTK